MERLYDQMKRDLEIRNFSPHTRRTYLACVRRFALYFHRSPEELGDPEMKREYEAGRLKFPGQIEELKDSDYRD